MRFLFGADAREYRSLSKRLGQALIAVAAREEQVDDLNLAYFTARGEVEELEARVVELEGEVAAMNRRWNQAVGCGIVPADTRPVHLAESLASAFEGELP